MGEKLDKKVRFTVKKALVALNEEDPDYKVEYATIVVTDKEGKFFKVHPITEFIKTCYAKSDFNYGTQVAAASHIVRFLNWLLVEKKDIYKIFHFEEITLQHGVDFLTHLKTTKYRDRARSKLTLEKYDMYITHFYSWLVSKKIIKGRTAEVVEERTYKAKNNQIVTKSIFVGNGFSLPSTSIGRDELTLEEFPHPRLITMFFETADDIAPDIVLGIYLQIFGGLRRGEVVNVIRRNLTLKGPKGIKGVTVKIGYKPHLWRRLKDPKKCNVKRDAQIFPVQPIQIISSLWKPIYEQHMKHLEKYSKVNKVGALFVDKDGNPMSGAVYENRFKKVKEAFLKRVKDDKYMKSYYAHLVGKSWCTHIGRRIYTNLMAKIVKSPSELAILRADKNLETALIYLSKQAVRREIQDGLQAMYESALEEGRSFEEDFVGGITDTINNSELLLTLQHKIHQQEEKRG